MTPAQVTEYRSGVQSQAVKTEGQLSDLVTQYNACVKNANTATDVCRTALVASYTVTKYEGSTLSADSLATGFGLGGLQVAHFMKMKADATQFEKDIKGINDTSLNPATREARINALMAKYGDDITDPVFATKVATDEGPDYFKGLEASIANNFYGAPGRGQRRPAHVGPGVLRLQRPDPGHGHEPVQSCARRSGVHHLAVLLLQRQQPARTGRDHGWAGLPGPRGGVPEGLPGHAGQRRDHLREGAPERGGLHAAAVVDVRQRAFRRLLRTGAVRQHRGQQRPARPDHEAVRREPGRRRPRCSATPALRAGRAISTT